MSKRHRFQRDRLREYRRWGREKGIAACGNRVPLSSHSKAPTCKGCLDAFGLDEAGTQLQLGGSHG